MTFRPYLPLSHPGHSLTLRLLVLAFTLAVSTASAQWQTEDYILKPGWNGIWLPLDVPHLSIEETVPAEVEEVWRWNANVAGTFSTTPTQTDLQWSVWRRTDAAGSNFGVMDGNYAYLIRVNAAQVGNISWALKGKPLPPRYDWTSTGVNFVGFPIETPTSTTLRNLSRFYSFDPVLKTMPTTLFYNGGELSSVAPKNPLTIGNANSYPLVRHQAYWVQATSFTEYYGPLQVSIATDKGLAFGSEGASVELRIKNVAVNSTNTQSVNVTLAPQASESAPAGQTAHAGAVPLSLRGDLDLNTGLYAYASLSGPVTYTLAPGQEREFIFTVNRSLLASTAGVKYASLLRITDSLNLTRIMLPVTAESTSRAGLWVGAAVLDKVDFVEGSTVVQKSTPAAFPLRLLLHSSTDGTVRLLQQAYAGAQGGVDVVSDKETAFTSPAKAESRLSSAHFPLRLTQAGTGVLGLTGTLTFSVPLGYTASDNPFVHAYHPDHDNKDERFQVVLPAGRESNNVNRTITLTFESSNAAGFDPTWGATTLGGTYTETVTGLRAVPLTTSGRFQIQRVSQAATFITQP